MFRILFVLFVIIPIIEIAVLMQVGAWLGAWPTIAIVVITAWLGAKNVKQQGIATLHSVQQKMAQGEMPSQEIVAGLLLLIAGVLLVTPGFVTDIFGLSLLIPQCRKALVSVVQKHLIVNQLGSGQGFSAYSQTRYSQQYYQNDSDIDEVTHAQSSERRGETIDGEFERKE